MLSLPRDAAALLTSYQAYGACEFIPQGGVGWGIGEDPQSWLPIIPMEDIPQDQLGTDGRVTAPAYAWVLKLTLRSNNARGLYSFHKELMRLGLIVPDAYTQLRPVMLTTSETVELEVSHDGLHDGDVILRVRPPWYRIRRVQQHTTRDPVNSEYAVTISYPALREKDAELKSLLEKLRPFLTFPPK